MVYSEEITNNISEVLASFPLLILQRLLHVFPTQLKTYSKFIINKNCNYLKHASYVQSDWVSNQRSLCEQLFWAPYGDPSLRSLPWKHHQQPSHHQRLNNFQAYS